MTKAKYLGAELTLCQAKDRSTNMSDAAQVCRKRALFSIGRKKYCEAHAGEAALKAMLEQRDG